MPASRHVRRCRDCHGPLVGQAAAVRYLCQPCRARIAEQRRQYNRGYYRAKTQQHRQQAREAPGANLLACCGRWHRIETLPCRLNCCGRVVALSP